MSTTTSTAPNRPQCEHCGERAAPFVDDHGTKWCAVCIGALCGAFVEKEDYEAVSLACDTVEAHLSRLLLACGVMHDPDKVDEKAGALVDEAVGLVGCDLSPAVITDAPNHDIVDHEDAVERHIAALADDEFRRCHVEDLFSVITVLRTMAKLYRGERDDARRALDGAFAEARRRCSAIALLAGACAGTADMCADAIEALASESQTWADLSPVAEQSAEHNAQMVREGLAANVAESKGDGAIDDIRAAIEILENGLGASDAAAGLSYVGTMEAVADVVDGRLDYVEPERRTQPLRDLILVELPERETVTAGGIIIPDTTKQAPDRGTVLDVGPDVHEVTAGDVVLFRRDAGVPHPGQERTRLMEEAEVLAVLVEKGRPSEAVLDWVEATTCRFAGCRKAPSPGGPPLFCEDHDLPF